MEPALRRAPRSGHGSAEGKRLSRPTWQACWVGSDYWAGPKSSRNHKSHCPALQHFRFFSASHLVLSLAGAEREQMPSLRWSCALRKVAGEGKKKAGILHTARGGSLLTLSPRLHLLSFFPKLLVLFSHYKNNMCISQNT